MYFGLVFNYISSSFYYVFVTGFTSFAIEVVVITCIDTRVAFLSFLDVNSFEGRYKDSSALYASI